MIPRFRFSFKVLQRTYANFTQIFYTVLSYDKIFRGKKKVDMECSKMAIINTEWVEVYLTTALYKKRGDNQVKETENIGEFAICL